MARILLTSGGTGGHVFPAEALATELQKRGHDVVFCLDNRFYKKSQTTAKKHLIASGALGGNPLRKLRGGLQLLRGYLQSILLIKKFKPQVVVGFGGYTSFPVLLAAKHADIPLVLHEQNSLLGRVNRFFLAAAKAIATSFPEVKGIDEAQAKKIYYTGNPVRAQIAALHGMEYPQMKHGAMLRILVTGGSQGASVFSRVIPDALAELPELLRECIRLDQQVRESELDAVRARYQQLSIHADLQTFFSDMPARLSYTHLVIARAGASTLAELAMAGRPAVLVPYPHAKDNHQAINAEAFAQADAGWVLREEDFTQHTLARIIQQVLEQPDMLSQKAAQAAKLAMPNAAQSLADVVETIC